MRHSLQRNFLFYNVISRTTPSPSISTDVHTNVVNVFDIVDINNIAVTTLVSTLRSTHTPTTPPVIALTSTTTGYTAGYPLPHYSVHTLQTQPQRTRTGHLSNQDWLPIVQYSVLTCPFHLHHRSQFYLLLSCLHKAGLGPKVI